jgi:hypothetical protein
MLNRKRQNDKKDILNIFKFDEKTIEKYSENHNKLIQSEINTNTKNSLIKDYNNPTINNIHYYNHNKINDQNLYSRKETNNIKEIDPEYINSFQDYNNKTKECKLNIKEHLKNNAKFFAQINSKNKK